MRAPAIGKAGSIINLGHKRFAVMLQAVLIMPFAFMLKRDGKAREMTGVVYCKIPVLYEQTALGAQKPHTGRER